MLPESRRYVDYDFQFTFFCRLLKPLQHVVYKFPYLCFDLDCLCVLALWASRRPALPVVLIQRQRYVDSDFQFSFLC
jgi:hypothetical protein